MTIIIMNPRSQLKGGDKDRNEIILSQKKSNK